MKQSTEYINLLERLNNKTALIAVIGMGYVGLPLALSYAEANYKVLGIDIDKNKVKKINDSESYINHISSEKIKNLVNQNTFKATTSFSEVKNADAIILCLPTPLNKYREPDLSFIRNTLNSIKPYLKNGQV